MVRILTQAQWDLHFALWALPGFVLKLWWGWPSTLHHGQHAHTQAEGNMIKRDFDLPLGHTRADPAVLAWD